MRGRRSDTQFLIAKYEGERLTKERNVEIVTGNEKKKIVRIHDIRFQGKRSLENRDPRHIRNAQYGWYRYDAYFELPVYDEDGEIERYNRFRATMLIRHSADGKKYLYDMLDIKKETSNPLSS